MNRLIINILVGLLCKVILSKRNITVYAHNCELFKLGDYLAYNCSNRGLLEVPQDLNPSVEVLFLMNNTFNRLHENSFAVYRKLVFLNLAFTAYTDLKEPINYNTFWLLEKLQLLDIRNVATSANFFFNWPPNLEVIWISDNRFITDLDLSALKELKILDAGSCGLESFPKFHKLAPLISIDLMWNPLRDLTVEDLAPFCLLKTLLLQWSEISPLSSPDKYCLCLRLVKWMQMFEIRYQLHPTTPSFICTPPLDAKNHKCDLEYSEELLQQRVECLERNTQPLFSRWFLVVVAIIVLTPFVILACWYSERRQKLLLRRQTRRQGGEIVEEEHDTE